MTKSKHGEAIILIFLYYIIACHIVKMYYKASMFNNIALSIIQNSYVHFDVNIKMNVNIGCDHG